MKALHIATLFWAAACVAADGPGAKPGAAANAVLAEVDGRKLTLQDLEKERPAAMYQARNAFHQAQRKATDELIDEYLLEREAKRQNTTVTKLIEKYTSAIPDPSEEALRVYYEGVDTKEPFEAVRDRILDAIRQRRQAKAKETYLLKLRSEAKIEMRLAPPRAQIALKDIPVRGPAGAPVLLVEYADYECPYCQAIQPSLAKLKAEFAGKLAFAFKDVPLPMHSNAQKAAEASHCAGAQGKYWEYHDLLFATKEYQLPQLKEHARKLQLNAEAFDRCLDSGTNAEFVKSQLAEAQALGLPGTPGFFVNGRVVPGASYDSLKQMIEEELGVAARTSQKSGGPLASR